MAVGRKIQTEGLRKKLKDGKGVKERNGLKTAQRRISKGSTVYVASTVVGKKMVGYRWGRGNDRNV